MLSTFTPHTTADVLAMVTFNPEDGRIWFNQRRMLLLDAASFATLRNTLIGHLGMSAARALLTQVGYRSGVSDAEMLRRDWPDDFQERSRIGTRFHGLAGITKVEPVHTDFRPKEGYFRGEFIWRHTVEDDAHIRAHGLGTDPACWMEMGYATGYLSTVCGQLILFREFECRSMGSDVCRVLGQPAVDWGDVTEDLGYLGLAASAPAAAPAFPATPMPAAVRSGPTPAAQAVGEMPAESSPTLTVIGQSAALKATSILLRKVAPTRATVLITGESGTGKELFARVLHQESKRAAGPFVAVNCAAIPENLIESELFGVARGGFTGAVQSRPGRFERAEGGTLFLDEVGTLSMSAQAKLLRALQEHEVERVGATSTVKVDARIVAATNVNLGEAVARGEFRDDLFYRLNVFPIHLPPLRERRDDIPELIDHFLQRFNDMHEKAVTRLTGRALQRLLNYRFPGNIRELENLMERAVILADDDQIDLPHLFTGGQTLESSFYRLDAFGALVSDQGGDAVPAGVPEDGQLNTWAEQWVEACAGGRQGGVAGLEQAVFAAIAEVALERCQGNVAGAARLLGMKRHQLEYRLKARPRPA